MEVKRICAAYWSATGNTDKTVNTIAETLAEKLGVPLERRNFTRPSDRAEDLSFTGRDLVVFGMPTYAGKLPNKMLPYVQQQIHGNGALAVGVVTFGNRSYDNSLAELCAALEAAGFHNYPIVLHGASSVDQRCVAMCNEYGGNIAGAKGIPAEMLRKASSMAVCKINMDTDLRLAMTAAVRKSFGDEPAAFDPRGYLGAGRALIQELVEDKIKNVIGSTDSMN